MFKINNAVKILGLAGCLLGLSQVFLACGSEEGSELQTAGGSKESSKVEKEIKVLSEAKTESLGGLIDKNAREFSKDEIHQGKNSFSITESTDWKITFTKDANCRETGNNEGFTTCVRSGDGQKIAVFHKNNYVTWVWFWQKGDYIANFRNKECGGNTVTTDEVKKDSDGVEYKLTCTKPTRKGRSEQAAKNDKKKKEEVESNSAGGDLADCKLGNGTQGFRGWFGICTPKRAGGQSCESDRQCISGSCKLSGVWGKTCTAKNGPDFITRIEENEDQNEFNKKRNKEVANWIWSDPKDKDKNCKCSRADNWFGKVTCDGKGSQAKQEAECGGMFQIPIKPTQTD